MAVEKLTNLTIINAKPKEKAWKLSDGGGLYIEVQPSGAKYWRLKYRIAGVERRVGLGVFPAVTLKEARLDAQEKRKQVGQGIDPSDERKRSKVALKARVEEQRRADEGLPGADSFEAIAGEWLATKQGVWSKSHGDKVLARLKADIFPYIGRRALASIKPPELLEVFRRIEARGVGETVHRACESCSQVFRFGVLIGRAESDPARDLKGALKKPMVKHHAAIVEPKRFGELLRAAEGYQGTPVVRAALKLAPMLFLRPGELRFARWCEMDLDSATWTIPAHRMKQGVAAKLNGAPHVVPLARQAVEVLRDLQQLTGNGDFVFRGERHHGRAMSENTVNAALRAMGFPAEEVTGHGFRATARTMIAERLGLNENHVEAQLAHSVKDSLGTAYNRTQFLEQRRQMMQAWADYLDKLRVGAEVVPITTRAA